LAEVPIQGLTSALWLYMTPKDNVIRMPFLDAYTQEQIDELDGLFGFIDSGVAAGVHIVSNHEIASGVQTGT